MPLTNISVRNLKPADKSQKHFDGGGLFLFVTPAGGKLWRLKYRYQGKEKLLSLGSYPEVSLSDARERRDHARKLLAAEVDPGMHKKAKQLAMNGESANGFEVIAREWFAKFSPNWVPSHADKIIRRLEKDIFPWLGKNDVADITASALLSALQRIANRGALETAHRALQNCGQVFRYAVATGRAPRDPSGDLRGALPPAKGKHHASITEPKAIGELLCTIQGYQGSFVTKSALQLAPIVFCATR